MESKARPDATKAARTRIDTIVYLASLVSKRQEIEQPLDQLRQLTAIKGPDATYSAADLAKLEAVQRQLESYLLDKESLRGFTRESLQAKIATHQETASPAAQIRPILVLVWLVALGSALASYALSGSTTVNERLSASIPLFYMCIFAGASWLCFTALKSFKKELHTPYLIFAIGVGVMGLTFVYTAILKWLGQSDTNWEHLEVTLLPFLASYIAVYIGMRSFAWATGITSWAMSAKLVLSICAVAGVAVIALPHTDAYATEFFFDLSVATLALTGIFSIVGSIIMYQLQKRITPLYARPIRWLLASYITMAIPLWVFMFLRFTEPGVPEGGVYGILLALPTAVGGLLMLKAAADFNKVSEY